ncbi:MAG: UbiD family decarboxylase [Dehalococcoidia bacterium]|nr:UbiD family decarboxylase [Dehalococcoidia bacterium]
MDLRGCLQTLESQGLLKHVTAEVDRTWEISAISRWAFLGFPEGDRFALAFDNVRGHDMPVVAGVIGASYKTYAACLGIDTSQEKEHVIAQIRQRWARALDQPLTPKLVSSGPCQENILLGRQIDIHRFPIPVWAPEKDCGWEKGYGYITAPCHVTRDPDTGITNVGTYRSMVREDPDEIGLSWAGGSHMRSHFLKNEARGKATEIATVIGGEPSLGMVSVARVPSSLSELAVAGGLQGEPIALVKCQTVDLEVPANAEIVIEGRLPPRGERPYEAEGPFGEHTGYQGLPSLGPVYEITCITYRNMPIYQAFVSQMPPSESSKLRHISEEALLLWQLRRLEVADIVDVHSIESAQSGFIVISIRKASERDASRVANTVFATLRSAKFVVVTDDDIDIQDLSQVMWAITFKTSLVPTRRNIHFYDNCSAMGLDYSAFDSMERVYRAQAQAGVLIDATRPFTPYPTTSLPPAKYLEKARGNWTRTGLPPILNSNLPKCILLEEDYLRKGLAKVPERILPQSVE